jgi:carboxyl-terminal processing protease
MRRHPSQQIDNKTFNISDADYADFVEFMSDKEVPYQSQTRLALEMLQRTSKQERYDDDFAEEMALLESKLKDQKMDNLQNYRAEIENLLNADIVLRHNYQQGVVEYNIARDSMVMQAIDMLRDSERYTRILKEQDTEKN